ncbi:hypothetical protein LSAT2_003023 [Lamellibrachia satsuma]|nr:hypothetical protein LSAT2_003023 [Lamellibrachia satsuma]
MLRDDSFLNGLPDEFRWDFIDPEELAPLKLQVLKDRIRDRFPSKQVMPYHMEYDCFDPDSEKPKFIDTGDTFFQTDASLLHIVIHMKGFTSFCSKPPTLTIAFMSSWKLITRLTSLSGQPNRVFDFFKRRIAEQYPLEEKQQDPYQDTKEQHEAFMKSRCNDIVGRDDVLKQIDQHVCAPASDVPLLLLGAMGMGKSSVMCQAADQAVNKAVHGNIPSVGRTDWRVFYHFVGAVPGSTDLFSIVLCCAVFSGGRTDWRVFYHFVGAVPGSTDLFSIVLCCAVFSVGRTDWRVFYHFVGAVPGSTDLFSMLKRLLLEMEVVSQANLPISLHNAVLLTCATLTNVDTRPTLIFIDALNQFDEDQASTLVSWMPLKLAPQVRCVFSMIDDTPQYVSLASREPSPHECHLGPLTRDTRQGIVERLLDRYGKSLDKRQMRILLDKESSKNPYWLSIAVEELRVYGDFHKVSEKIQQLSDGLLELENQVLERFEQESGGELLTATLCLLEVSQRGLLETELISILTSCDNIMPPKKDTEKGGQGHEKKQDMGRLPAAKWAEVYTALRPFLRPFGESGEGRLDFYHRSLSKAVRKRYFSGAGDDDAVKTWWHTKLADYFESFETTEANVERKVEHQEDGHHESSININVHTLEAVKDFTYLGSTITINLSTDVEINKRICKASSAKSRLTSRVWENSALTLNTREYPFHLIAAHDRDRLEEFLVEWPVCDEVPQSKLMQFWLKGSDLRRLKHCCLASINNLANSTNSSTTKDLLSARQHNIAILLKDAGHYIPAAELIKSSMAIETEELGSRPGRMAALHYLRGSLLAEELNRERRPDVSQLPRVREIIEEFEAAAELFQQMGVDYKGNLADTLRTLSFNYSRYSQLDEDNYLAAAEAKEKALSSIESAIEMFKELNAEPHMAEALMTKAAAYDDGSPEQIKVSRMVVFQH